MVLLSIDVSNYTSPLTPENLQALKDAGVSHAIVQSIDPPPGYPVGRTREQITALLAAGFTVDAYVWLWMDLDTMDILHKLSLLDGLPVRQLWLDVEDTAAVKYDQAMCELKVDTALKACDQYPTTSGQKTGIYTGRWYWADPRYMGNSTKFSDRELWDSRYDDIPDTQVGFTPYGGWSASRIKQFRGTSVLAGISGIDLNVLSVAEEAELTAEPAPPEPEPQPEPCAAIQTERDGLVSSLGFIAGDLLKPVIVQKSTTTKAVRNLIAGIREQARQHGIQSA